MLPSPTASAYQPVSPTCSVSFGVPFGAVAFVVRVASVDVRVVRVDVCFALSLTVPCLIACVPLL